MKMIVGISLAVGSITALCNLFGMEWRCIDLAHEIFSEALQPLSCALSPVVYWAATGVAGAIGWYGISLANSMGRRSHSL